MSDLTTLEGGIEQTVRYYVKMLKMLKFKAVSYIYVPSMPLKVIIYQVVIFNIAAVVYFGQNYSHAIAYTLKIIFSNSSL